jgi:hypothetical protein
MPGMSLFEPMEVKQAMRPLPMAGPTIQVRLHNDGSLDEVVSKGARVHVEDMGDWFWMSIEDDSGRRVTVKLLGGITPRTVEPLYEEDGRAPVGPEVVRQTPTGYIDLAGETWKWSKQ